jgi:murein DD-endopeptidase MepM/ murein hydrolase activator NlpD
VAHGGTTATLNHHHAVAAQRYALDIVALGPGGRRATGLLPQRAQDYAIHGRAILAPCAGTVLLASDGAPETPIGGADPAAPAGNHVALGCTIGGRAVTLLLAHMAPGSVAVEVGTAVAAGTPLGRAGSSGNSSEPHLHLHAVRGTVSDLTALVVGATPVPLTIEGRFLVRNQTFGVAP